MSWEVQLEEINNRLLMAALEDESDYRHEVLTTEQLVQNMVECVRKVNEVLQNPVTITRIFLSHFKWDKEKLMERYFDGNLDKLFSECHVVNPGMNSQSTRPPINMASTAQDVPCEICYVDYPNTYFTGLECGHNFCRKCWGHYLTDKIVKEGKGQTISCPSHECDILVDDDTVIRLISNSKVKLKYQHLITNSFVDCNRLLKWCPAPGCHHVIKVQHPEARPVRCKCGHEFCFSCREKCHDPIRCKRLKSWIKLYKKDLPESKCVNWIEANTKDCPKCHSPIEKNGGCNWIVCGKRNCGILFCWVCLKGPDKHDGAHNCNSYKDDAGAAKKRPIADMHRYRFTFYYERYMNHMQGLRLEQRLYANVKEKMKEVTPQFLKTAVDVLGRCRSTLMYTYAFAFYLKKNNQAVIFENNQADLENATGVLSGYLEREISQGSLPDIERKVQHNKYKYCESRRRTLLKHVHEGYENDLWEYIRI